jgi:hypothetical protein
MFYQPGPAMYLIGILALVTTFFVYPLAALATLLVPVLPEAVALVIGTVLAVIVSIALVSAWVHRRYPLVAASTVG